MADDKYTSPEFIDNREVTMADAIVEHLAHLKTELKDPPEVSIATGYFNAGGFCRILPGLEGCNRIRVLLGAEPTASLLARDRRPGDPRGFEWERRLLADALRDSQAVIDKDRDRIPFMPAQDRSVKELLTFLESAPIEVRRYTKAFLHGKAYLFGGRHGVLSGSSNLTVAGLTTNLELNLGSYQPGQVEKVGQWFEHLWDEAEPYDLAAVYEARYAEYDPYLIYMRVLWERYGAELELETPDLGRIRLTTFQRDGLDRAIRVLGRYEGVLVADGVGLGKSFIAGEMIRQAIEEDNRRVLLVAPAALRDGMWERFRATYQLGVTCISYEELVADPQLGGDGRDHLKRDVREFDIVVVDEAQAFRNPDTKRAQALRRLLLGKPKKKLILLSATPVNNSLWDLHTLFRYFLGHDGAFAKIGIPSLREEFKAAAAIDPYDLSPDALFDVIDEVTVRRTRRFVKRFYPNEHIRLKDGSEVVIRFPRPHVSAVNYEIGDSLPGFFDEFAQALAPTDGEDPELSMARYTPTRYHRDGEVAVSELALVGLIRSGLLKRFESSIHAFRLTVERMIESHGKFLAALERGYVALMKDLDEWSPGDSDEELDRILEEGDSDPADLYDVVALKEAVEEDMAVLRRFHDRVGGHEATNDPKLARLVDELEEIIAGAKAESDDDEDYRDKRKVLVFSYYKDTLDWIEEYLEKALAGNPKLEDYRGRMVSVSGTERRDGVSREAAVFGFVPVSSEAPVPEDRYDIMLATDVLAEGMNLQQCRNIINFDLPWNPMRLVQRNGRIDRIGSPHTDVYMRCFFPDKELDEMLTLEERIRTKLARAAATIGIESEVVPGGAVSERNFSETREEIGELRREDATLLETEGKDPAALSGEEYRQELRKALQERKKQICGLPACAGSGLAGGNEAGTFFCAKVGDRVFLRFVRDQVASAAQKGDGTTGGPPEKGRLPEDDPVVRGTLTCLKLIHCEPYTPRDLDQARYDRAYEHWLIARRDIYEAWEHLTDPANLIPKVERLFRQMAEHVRQHPADLSQERQERLIETLEAPWDVRTRRAFKELFDPDADGPGQLTMQIEAKVAELGMEPFEMPEPLPVIEEEDVKLVCWMGIRTGVPGRSSDQ